MLCIEGTIGSRLEFGAVQALLVRDQIRRGFGLQRSASKARLEAQFRVKLRPERRHR